MRILELFLNVCGLGTRIYRKCRLILQDRVALEAKTMNSYFAQGKVCLNSDDCLSCTKIWFSGGDIHIWDQESGALLHLIRAQTHGGDLTCIAWNNAADDPYMFAAGSYDGGVKVWTRQQSDNALEFEPTPTNRDAHEYPRTSSPYQMDSNMSGSSIFAE
jgi:WD40 repeat protein